MNSPGTVRNHYVFDVSQNKEGARTLLACYTGHRRLCICIRLKLEDDPRGANSTRILPPWTSLPAKRLQRVKHGVRGGWRGGELWR